MTYSTVERLRRPAYARELAAQIKQGASVNLHAHVGVGAWDRARRREGERLIVVLDELHGPDDYDFSVVCGLDVLLNAKGADFVLARAIAVRMCEAGARVVALVHASADQLCEFFYSSAS